MICLLLLVNAAPHIDAARRRKDEPTTFEIIEGPLHAITSNPTTSFETYSGTMTSNPPDTKPPTPSRYSDETRTPAFQTDEPVVNKVFTAQRVEVTQPAAKKTNFTFHYSSMTPLPSPSLSSSQPIPLPNTTLSQRPSQHVTNRTVHVTNKTVHVLTTRPRYNTQPENGTEEEDNNTVTECEECALARPLGYLICCLVIVGVLINLLCYLHFLRRVGGVAGFLFSVFTLSDVILLLCLVPVAVSYISYQGAPHTPIPLRYSKVWLYSWNFACRYNLFLLSLLSLRGGAESQLRPLSYKVVVGLMGSGAALWLLLTLLPLFLSPNYTADPAFLLHDVRVSVGVSVVSDVVLGVFVLATICGLAAAALPNKRKYALVTQGGDEANGKVVKKRGVGGGGGSIAGKDVSSSRLYTPIFCIINIVFKVPLLILHGLGRYGKERSLTPLFGAALMALALGAALLDSLIYLTASICSHSTRSEIMTGDNAIQEQPV